MLRLVLLLALLLTLAGCEEQKKSDEAAPPPDASIFDKKGAPKAPTIKPPLAQKGS